MVPSSGKASNEGGDLGVRLRFVVRRMREMTVSLSRAAVIFS
jgi:hypothetical protein